MARARAGADDVEGGAAVAEAMGTAAAGQAEVAGQAVGLDVHGGDDEDATHASVEGGPPEGMSAAAGPACLRFSQAAYELPAAVSRPVNAMLWISA